MDCCCTQMGTHLSTLWCVPLLHLQRQVQLHAADMMLASLDWLHTIRCSQGSTIVLRDNQDSSTQEFLQVSHMVSQHAYAAPMCLPHMRLLFQGLWL
jgi:hypothetical protein